MGPKIPQPDTPPTPCPVHPCDLPRGIYLVARLLYDSDPLTWACRALTDGGFPLRPARKPGDGKAFPRPLPHLTHERSVCVWGEKPSADPKPGGVCAGRQRFPTCLGVPIDSCQIRSDGERRYVNVSREGAGSAWVSWSLPSPRFPQERHPRGSGFSWVTTIWGSGEVEGGNSLAAGAATARAELFPRDRIKTLRKQQHFPKELIKSIKLFTSGLHQSCVIWEYNRKATSLKSKRRRRFPGRGTDL